MKKATVRLCLLLLLCVVFLSSCGMSNQTGKSTEGASSPATSRDSGSPKADAAASPGITDADEHTGSTQIAGADGELKIPVVFKDGVKFERDGSATVSMEYDADSDKEQKLKLQAPDGILWELAIPAHALLEDTKITITSLKNIKSPSLGALKAGVLLEPDGLQFYKPAALTLSGNAGKNPVLLGGNHDGSKIGFSIVEGKDTGITAKLLHFSSIYDYPLDDENKLTQLKETARGNYEEIRQIALDFLKQPVRVPKLVPMSLRCPADHEKKYDDELRRFLAVFYHPEGEIAQELLAAGRMVALLNGDENAQEAIDICRQLAKRLIKKADKLYGAYYPQEEYLLPIGTAALSAERDYQLLGGPDDRGTLEMIGDWAKKVSDQFLNELRKEHDYKAAKPALRLGREAILLSGGGDYNYFEKIKAALRFEVRYETEVVLEGTEGNATYKTSGTAPYTVRIDPLDEIYSTGHGEYDQYTCPEPQVSLKLPNGFKFITMVENFDPCFDKPFDIYINKFGAGKETMIAGGYVVKQPGVVQATITALFREISVVKAYDIKNGSGDAFFRFSVPLQNRNATAAEKTVNKSIDGVSVKVTVRLVHKP